MIETKKVEPRIRQLDDLARYIDTLTDEQIERAARMLRAAFGDRSKHDADVSRFNVGSSSSRGERRILDFRMSR